MTSIPHPDLVPILEENGLSWEQFSRKGRLPKELHWIAEKRRDIITTLHIRGMPWKRMIEVTGLSLGAIERGTRAMWNKASRKNSQENAAKTARARKGEKKPWLTDQLKAAWRAGEFDFHRGRIRSDEEKTRLREGWTPERRAEASEYRKKLWQIPDYREPLLEFHRSDSQRRIRSENTSEYIRKAQCTGRLWSIPAWYTPRLCSNYPIFTKSSYERAACDLFDEDPTIQDYDYEPLLKTDDGFSFLPDFVVRFVGGTITLIEVKASWVLNYPDEHPKIQRLVLARDEAIRRGWGFVILTEKNGLHDAIKARKTQESLLRRAP